MCTVFLPKAQLTFLYLVEKLHILLNTFSCQNKFLSIRIMVIIVHVTLRTFTFLNQHRNSFTFCATYWVKCMSSCWVIKFISLLFIIQYWQYTICAIIFHLSNKLVLVLLLLFNTQKLGRRLRVEVTANSEKLNMFSKQEWIEELK